MKSFEEYVNQKNEGLLGNIWGATKGAFRGIKQGWGDAQVADKNAQYQQLGAPAGFIDMRNVNGSLSPIHQAVQNMQDQQAKEEVAKLLADFQNKLQKIFWRYSDQFVKSRNQSA